MRDLREVQRYLRAMSEYILCSYQMGTWCFAGMAERRAGQILRAPGAQERGRERWRQGSQDERGVMVERVEGRASQGRESWVLAGRQSLMFVCVSRLKRRAVP